MNAPRRWVPALLLACALPAIAALPTVPSTPAAPPSHAGSLLQAAFGMLVVLGLVFACAWLARRFGFPRLAGSQSVKVVSSTSIGTRERVVVVEVAGTWLVLGVTPTQVSALHSLPARETLPSAPAGEPGAGGMAAAFATRLRDALANGRKAGP